MCPKKSPREAIKANPEKSNRAIAAEIGTSEKTVRKARTELGAEGSAPERKAADGKTYRVDAAERAEARCRAKWKAFTAEEERDRKECVALAQKAATASREAVRYGIDLLELTEDPSGNTTQERWQNSLSNLAGEAIALRAYWTKQFGEWEKFDRPKEIKTLALQAMVAWGGVAAQLIGGEAAERWGELSKQLSDELCGIMASIFNE